VKENLPTSETADEMDNVLQQEINKLRGKFDPMGGKETQQEAHGALLEDLNNEADQYMWWEFWFSFCLFSYHINGACRVP